MATALAKGIVQAGLIPADRILAADIDPASLARFGLAIPGSTGLASNNELAARSELLVLAVKPQRAAETLASLPLADSRTLVLSVMAGIRIATLERWLKTPRVMRCIPNTPSLIGQGAIALAASPAIAAEQLGLVEQLLQSIGLVVRTSEAQLDAVTGLSGSGPAFVFSFLRGLIAGGIAAGLSPDVARRLAVQTVAGAAAMLRDPAASPEELIAQVTSPGGTTVRGLEVLQAGKFENLVADCVAAAARRAEELGQAAG